MRAQLLLAITLVGCASGMRITAVATESVALASLTCDAGSTHAGMESPRYVETNPVMGDHPGTTTQVAYFGAVGAALVGVNEAFQHAEGGVAGDVLRTIVNVAVVGVEIFAVSGNTSIGVPLCGI